MTPDFSKYTDGLMPAIVQDAVTNKVLMLGFMNEDALNHTEIDGRVTFYSRSKQRLWTKGESSGNFLVEKEILLDCDNDTLLIKAYPTGPVCHTGAYTCFSESNFDFSLEYLERIIRDRKEKQNSTSYTSTLFSGGINKISQKFGEEAVELIIESKDDDKEKFLNEAADLLYHYIVLLQAKDCKLNDVVNVLASRQKSS